MVRTVSSSFLAPRTVRSVAVITFCVLFLVLGFRRAGFVSEQLGFQPMELGDRRWLDPKDRQAFTIGGL